MYLKKVISGGQTGADLAGLLAAQAAGLETGGHIPKGFKTEDGPKPSLTKLGLIETKSSGYEERTGLNVKNSDATIIASMDMSSPGTKMTQAFCDKYKKPVAGIRYNNNKEPSIEKTAERLADWLTHQKVEILNVAGNRGSKAPGLQYWLVQVLIMTFTLLKEDNED